MNFNSHVPGSATIRLPDNQPGILVRMSSTEKRLALLLFLALLGMSMPRTVFGQEFCSEPVAPYCVTTESEFDTMLQINRCEDDLNGYEEQIETYEKCIAGQVKTKRQALTEARRKLQEAKNNF